MNMKFQINKTIAAIALMVTKSIAGTYAQTAQRPQLGKASVKEVVAAMTTDEKIEFLSGISMQAAISKDGTVVGNIGGKVQGAAGSTVAFPSLNIPAIYFADGPAGVRIDTLREGKCGRYYSTAFPIGTLLASSWDTPMINRVGQAVANELVSYGVDVWLAPGMNIHRNPLCGRNFEYYSEDPVLAGKIAAAMVNGVQKYGVGVSIKHFAANNCETSRNFINSQIDERTLREIYLRQFQIAVQDAQPWTVMAAYNKINGTYSSESKDLLTTILRDEWGFKGLVMTDWYAGRNYAKQVAAGCDLLMPGRPAEPKQIKKALEDGTLTMAEVDRNVERILQLVLRSLTFRVGQHDDHPNLKQNAEVSREAAADGMVLLENNGALPLSSQKRIALFGPNSYDTFIGGSGSGEVYAAYTISVAKGLQEAGNSIVPALAKVYADSIAANRDNHKRNNLLTRISTIQELTFTDNDIKQYATDADMACITFGRNAGENSDRNEERDYKLSQTELQLLNQLSDAFHAIGKKVVVILNVDGVVDVNTWRNKADAILVAWLPGQEAGHAIADILCGKVNPSGKLPMTFPMAYSDVPSAKTFPNHPEEHPKVSVYNEGIYVGYRYYDKFKVKPAYEFGFGRSYTNFAYSNMSMKAAKDNVTVTFIVKNTGKVAGKEVAEVYVSAPTGQHSEANWQGKPEKELKAFAKTKLLAPGEQQTLTLTINKKDLASFYPSQSEWITDAGTYTVKVGSSSRDIRLEKQFKQSSNIVVEKTHKALLPETPIAVLMPQK